MLVTFSCNAYENITMFGDVAMRLLKMMGHGGTIPGAIVAADIPDALTYLQQGITLAKPDEQNAQNSTTTEDEEPNVSLAHRAIPLINMLKAAQDASCDIMWK